MSFVGRNLPGQPIERKISRVSLFQVETLAVNTALTLFGAVLITVGVFYLARLLRRRSRGARPSVA